MIFATDLDNTLIYSNRRLANASKKNLYCVEYYNGKCITYMTYSAIDKLKELIKKVNVIPITTRSISQFSRIEFFSSSEYAVTSNGGTILYNGKILPEWENYISDIVCKYNFQDVMRIFSLLPDLTTRSIVVDGKFVFTKSSNVDLCKQILLSKLDTKIWQLSFQGQKIYAIPSEITKGNALKFINENLLHDNLVVSAGDSNLDVSMLEYSNIGIIPGDSKLASLKQTNLIRLGNGLSSSDEILDFVNQLSSSKQKS